MLDVHPPHATPHGWRDFLIHIVTITISLLIALSLEGIVEWQHHRHLAHDAEASLHGEIKSNAKNMPFVLDELEKRKQILKHDVAMLKASETTHKLPDDDHIDIGFDIQGFDDVSWKTSQSTNALSYMPYELAKEFSNLYSEQDSLLTSEQQAARDAIVAAGPLLNTGKDDPAPSPQEAQAIIEKIEVLQGQILIVESFMKSLDDDYRKYLVAHPD